MEKKPKRPNRGEVNPMSLVRPMIPDESKKKGGPTSSASAVEGFNQIAKSRDSSGQRPSEGQKSHESEARKRSIASNQLIDPDEAEKEDERNFLTAEQWAEFQQYQMMLRVQDLRLMRDQEVFEDVKKAYNRNKQLEGRLEPIRLMDYVIRQYVTQKVPIVPGELEVTYRSLTLEHRLLMKDLKAEELTSWKAAKMDVDSQASIAQLLELCVGVESISGSHPWPHAVGDIHRVLHESTTGTGKGGDSLERAREMVKANMCWWKSRPEPLLMQLVIHQQAFNLRMRQQLDTAGLEKTVGK